MLFFQENQEMNGLIRNFIIVLFILIKCGAGLAQVTLTTSNLPIVVVNTNGQVIPDEPKIVVDMGIIYNGEGEINNIIDPFNDYDGKIAIELRGSTSQSFPKKSYSFETQDDFGANNNVSLINLPEENDWVFYGPFSDKSLMRNVITYELARRMGWYAPRTRYCEMILNEEYIGVYILTEKIKRDENRVDISNLTENDTIGDDLTGGYIMQIDGWDCIGWHSAFNYNIFFQNIYPDGEDILPIQEDYIKDFIYNIEYRLNILDNPEDSVIAEIIDIESFMDYIISNELSRNIDAYRLSTFMYKDVDSEDGRLKMGPVWDYNIAYGNCDYFFGYTIENFIYDDTTFFDHAPFWFRKLMTQSFFTNKIRCRWDDLRENVLSENSISILIDSCSNLLDEAQERNFEKWDILGHNIWPNYYIGDTYEEEIEILKDWIYLRLAWIDDYLPGECSQYVTEINPSSGIKVYPNPFNSELNIKIYGAEPKIVEFYLYDLYGREIIQKKFEGISSQLLINFEGINLRDGFYFYNCIIDGSIIHKGKLIKS